MAMTTTTCRSYILAEVNRLNHAFTYRDLVEGAKGRFTYGTIRNNICRLKAGRTILKFPKENSARFILADWMDRPEYKRWFQNDKTPMGVRGKVFRRGSVLVVNFASFVESLDWGELAYVHDVRVEFDAVHLDGVSSSAGWRWSPKCHSWRRKFDHLEFPLTVQVYDTGRVQVAVRCSLKPIPFDFEGLMRLATVLGELKGRLGWSNVPNVVDWMVTSWHYGKDSLKEVSGTSLNATFETWSRTLARIYTKSELKKIRVEEIQSPRRTVQDLFEEIMNREDTIRHGERLLPHETHTWQRKRQSKLSTSLVPNGFPRTALPWKY